MKLYIKHMVCDRCKMVVKTALEELGLDPISVELGEVVLANELDAVRVDEVKKALGQFGFELLADRKRQLAEQIKTAIIELVHYPKEPLRVNLSDYLSQKLGQEYTGLSAVFSECEHNTIEKYLIQQKIEKVKELLTYGEKSLSEIANLLNYSSVAHLSAQFKKVTGQTPSVYKQSSNKNRQQLDVL